MDTWRKIITMVCNILLLPISILLMIGLVWYTLPELANTSMGQSILSIFSTTAIFWITLGSAILFMTLLITKEIISRDISSKLCNFFTHTTSWVMGLVGIALAIATFVMINPLIANEVTITSPRKISIGICLALLIGFHIFSTKLSKIINRKIQSYVNAKEMGVAGRSSVIVVNLLRLLEVSFPELIILALLCFCVSWNVACYFIVILACSLIPVIGNIVCDFKARREVRMLKKLQENAFADKVANNLKEIK